MSHLATVTTRITDLSALQQAAHALRCSLQTGGQARFYGGLSEPCDYVLALPGRYDLGFKRQSDGSFSFVADEELLGGRSGTDGFGRNDPGRKLIGENGGILLQQYALAVVTKHAQSQQLTMSTEKLPDGRIKIVLK